MPLKKYAHEHEKAAETQINIDNVIHVLSLIQSAIMPIKTKIMAELTITSKICHNITVIPLL